MKYVCFVSYAIFNTSTEGRGFGSREVIFERPITSLEQLQEGLARSLRADPIKSEDNSDGDSLRIIILNFQLLRTERK
jgi:hypothetical protein